MFGDIRGRLGGEKAKQVLCRLGVSKVVKCGRYNKYFVTEEANKLFTIGIQMVLSVIATFVPERPATLSLGVIEVDNGPN